MGGVGACNEQSLGTHWSHYIIILFTYLCWSILLLLFTFTMKTSIFSFINTQSIQDDEFTVFKTCKGYMQQYLTYSLRQLYFLEKIHTAIKTVPFYHFVWYDAWNSRSDSWRNGRIIAKNKIFSSTKY